MSTATKAKHTPTPWRANPPSQYHPHAEIFGRLDFSPGAALVAELRPAAMMPRGEAMANARLIVRAVNSHDALVEALRRATPWLGKLIANGGHKNSVAPNDAVGALQQAEAALALATGKGGEA